MIVNISDAKANLSRLLARVADGEEVIIARRGKPIARIVPHWSASKRVLGQAQGRIVIADDFDDPVDPETWR